MQSSKDEIINELQETISSLKTKVHMMELQKEKNLIELMDVLTELDTVGIIRGAGSKARSKEALIGVLIENYGKDYKLRYKETLKKIKLKKEEETNGKQ